MRNNNITEPTPAELNEFIEAYQNATPEAQAEARAMLQAEPADDMSEERAFILSAFDYAMDNHLNDDTKAEAHELIKLYFGADCTDKSPMFSLMSGFIIGMTEGMRIAACLDKAAAERSAAQ